MITPSLLGGSYAAIKDRFAHQQPLLINSGQGHYHRLNAWCDQARTQLDLPVRPRLGRAWRVLRPAKGHWPDQARSGKTGQVQKAKTGRHARWTDRRVQPLPLIAAQRMYRSSRSLGYLCSRSIQSLAESGHCPGSTRPVVRL